MRWTMERNAVDDALVGRGARDGARLFREWFQGLTAAGEEQRRAAYVFVMGSLAELLRVFDLPIVFPEINSLQTAVRGVAHEYLNEAEDYGYSPDICGYVKADVALQLRGGQHPMGRVPRPGLVVLTNACNTYVKWAEIWERLHHVPVVTIDVPGTRAEGRAEPPGSPGFQRDCRYVEAQLRELIPLCERVSGVRFDPDRLREALGHANTLFTNWRRVIAHNRARPAVFNALTEGTIFLGVANALRGSPQGGRYFAELAEELGHKARLGIGTVEEEKFRLLFVGVPCYPIFRRFNEMFTQWGGVFAGSTYLSFASGGAGEPFQYDLADPLASLAAGLLLGVRSAMDSMFFQDRAVERLADEFGADGVVYHPIKSCRTVSTGLADGRRALLERRDIATLFLESDMMDRRVVSEAQLKNRIDAYFEGLESRRRRRQAGT
ncbi:MAG: 2-hydroxyacyl-CoA dehydratase subunit D [Planctomycetaceae bacterium]